MRAIVKVFIVGTLGLAVLFGSPAVGLERNLPMTPEEQQMWGEYLTATKPGAGPAALQIWARKYNVKLITPTRMETTRTVTNPWPGTQPPPSGPTPVEKCSNCQSSFSTSNTIQTSKLKTIIETTCKLNSCSVVCSGTPKQCVARCFYKCDAAVRQIPG